MFMRQLEFIYIRLLKLSYIMSIYLLKRINKSTMLSLIWYLLQ